MGKMAQDRGAGLKFLQGSTYWHVGEFGEIVATKHRFIRQGSAMVKETACDQA